MLSPLTIEKDVLERALDTINLHVNQKMGVPFADLIPFINEECRIAAEYV